MQHDFVSISVGTVYNGNFISSVIMQVSAGLRDAHLSVLHLDHMYMCLHIQRLEEVRNRTTLWGDLTESVAGSYCLYVKSTSDALMRLESHCRLGIWCRLQHGSANLELRGSCGDG